MRHPSIERVYQVELLDAENGVCATVEKTVYIKRKQQGEKEQNAGRYAPAFCISRLNSDVKWNLTSG